MLAHEAQPEEWRPIPGWEDLYEASSLGRVRRITKRPPYVLTPCPDKDGYRVVSLTRNNRWRPWRVAALVCSAFHGPRPEGLQAAHGDGVRTNDFPDNLRWATPLEQGADKNRHGTTVMGEKQHLSKLTRDQVVEIRSMASTMTGRAIAKKFNMTASAISAVINRKTWKHV